MKTLNHYIAGLLFASLVFVFFTKPALPQESAKGDLRDLLLKPDAGRGMIEFVGRDKSKTYGIGLVRSHDNKVMAYVSDGKKVGAWFTGSIKENAVHAIGTGGEVLDAVIKAGHATGKVNLSGKTVNFALETAGSAAGLKRVMHQFGGKNLEAVFVVTNDGAILGTAQSDNRVLYSYHAETAESATADETVADHTVQGSATGDPVPRAFIRCSILVLRLAKNEQDYLAGEITYAEYTENYKKFANKFAKLGCTDYYLVN